MWNPEQVLPSPFMLYVKHCNNCFPLCLKAPLNVEDPFVKKKGTFHIRKAFTVGLGWALSYTKFVSNIFFFKCKKV
jgi:hypothetical protein